MMGFIISMIIWLVGWLVSYVVLARVATNDFIATPGKWDNADRGFCAGISILSWLMVLICLVVLAGQTIKKYKVFTTYAIPFLKKLEPKRLRHE